eukprot:CCRYP_000769-RB/>CCRYP_000769-RB protein AED:0.48 eAED:0.48 QI:0/-1/0/1/-1/0/1/0/48
MYAWPQRFRWHEEAWCCMVRGMGWRRRDERKSCHEVRKTCGSLSLARP